MKNDLVDAKDIKTAYAKKAMNYNPHAGHRERLRKKFEENPEMNVFEDHEALEFHLSLVIPRKDTNELAHELLRTFGSLDAVLCATRPTTRISIRGISTHAARRRSACWMHRLAPRRRCAADCLTKGMRIGQSTM